jgi:spermidine synthase
MKHAKLAALFLVSVAGIAYELYVMRIFSVGSWSNFGSLVISTALLGIGLSGIILTFIDEWVQLYADLLMMIAAISLPLLMALAVAAAQLVPFDPVFLASDPRQIWFIGAYYIIYGFPFFGVATFTGAAFIALRDEIQKVYFWNMAGSGAGGFFIILFMFALPPQYLILPILALTVAAALCTCVDENGELPLSGMLVLAASALLSVCCVFVRGDIRLSDFKAVSYVRKYPDSRLVHHSYGPGGEYHVYASDFFHFAPGLSDNAALEIPVISRQPYWGLFVDGGGPVGVMGNLREDEKTYMDYLPMAAPYTMLARPNVLLVGLSGGINAQIARYKDAERIDIAEPSAEMIRLLRDDPNLSRFTGNLLNSPGIRLSQGEGRSWCLDHPKTYDLIELSLVDSIGLSDSGGYPVHEDFRYTVEAFKEYFGALTEGGILSVTVWDRLNPPRNVLRLLNSLITAMRESGFPEPERSLYSFGLFMSTSTMLVKNGAFTGGELYDLGNFVKTRSFELLYAPGTVLAVRDIDTLMGAYRKHFSGGGAQVESFTNADMYRASIPQFFAGREKQLERDYIFDIRPIRDSRPYYSGFLKLRNLSMYLDQMEDISEEWGYLLLLGMLIQACIFGFIVIVIPLLWRRRELFRSRADAGSTMAVIVYYAGLGLGYMLIEIYLIQRLGAFLSNPTYSASIVITVMLICSALGNLVSGLLRRWRVFVVPAACALVAACLLFHLFALDAFLGWFHSSSLALRIAAAAMIIAPPAFFMGIPYPNGLDSLQENKPHLLPWAWGMNGGLSVAGSALARIISVSSGFPVLLMVGIGVYMVVGLAFPVNLRRLSSW